MKEGKKFFWVEKSENLAIIFAYVLLALYVTPIYIIGFVALFTSGFQVQTFFFEWFVAFIRSSDSTLNLFHKVLLPILTGLSVVVFRKSEAKKIIGLAVFLLISLAVAIFMGVLLDMQRIQDALMGLKPSLEPALTKAFFSRIQEYKNTRILNDIFYVAFRN
jgi:ABC-type uncharacterized transport system permease subunit